MSQLNGKARVFGDNLNTDYVISGKYKFKTLDMNELAKHAMEDIRPGFYDEITAGDFVVAGENLGSGSSREQAPLVLKAAGIGAVVAKSFARIFYRNSINIGLVLVEAKIEADEGDMITIDVEHGTVRNDSNGKEWSIPQYPQYIRDLISSGGLMNRIKEAKRCIGSR